MPLPALVALFLLASLFPLATAAWTLESSGHFATEFGAALAILAATLLFLQFLSSGRFEALSGNIGIDRTMGFHRIAGVTLIAFAIAHPLSYVLGQFLDNPNAGVNRLLAMLSSPRLRSGVVAIALLVVLVGFASIRTRSFVRYELWRIAHGPMAVVAGALTLHHALHAGTYSADGSLRTVWLFYALLALGAAIVTYVVRPWRMWREHWWVETTNIASDGVTQLILRGPDRTTVVPRGGQFIWLTVSPHRPPFHDHPFSIASSAGFLPRLRLLVRNAGNCTDSFHSLATGTLVAIDGPHGSFFLPSATSAVVMVAGGVGIAPLLGMLEEAVERGDRRPFRLLYAARSDGAFACKRRLAELSDRLNLKVTYCADEACAVPGVIRGPICSEHLRGIVSGLALDDVSVMLCGPPSMMEMAADIYLSAGVPMGNIHYERFDYGAGGSQIDKWRRWTAIGLLAIVATSAVLFSLR